MKKLTKKQLEIIESAIIEQCRKIKKHSENVKKAIISLVIDADRYESFYEEYSQIHAAKILNELTAKEAEQLFFDWQFLKEHGIESTKDLWGNSDFDRSHTLLSILLGIKNARKELTGLDGCRVELLQQDFQQASGSYKYPRKGKFIFLTFGESEKLEAFSRNDWNIYPNQSQKKCCWQFSEHAKKFIIEAIEKTGHFEAPEI